MTPARYLREIADNTRVIRRYMRLVLYAAVGIAIVDAVGEIPWLLGFHR